VYDRRGEGFSARVGGWVVGGTVGQLSGRSSLTFNDNSSNECELSCQRLYLVSFDEHTTSINDCRPEMAVSAIGQLTSGTESRDETERRTISPTTATSNPVDDDCKDATTSGGSAAAFGVVERRCGDDDTDDTGRSTSSYKKNILQRYRKFPALLKRFIRIFIAMC